ncbi:hypothetical protein GCM10010387_19200 [Streptomyces inusitatus]|uniref:Uncharacterized protein n=1 Tax=Streptomyces inusitatus TaxID=68221 RepID=A0A918PXW2_9ACTN|nr:hypothetical protein [Streptomyces inusitatus]GGZ25785.1 hypothetical protein GCM10010387_19200 [Streptomyces inusitatus]
MPRPVKSTTAATTADEDVARQQAEITRLLLHHIHAPLAADLYLRGILPAPAPAEAVRFVIGSRKTRTPEGLLGYEIPLRANGEHGELRTGHDITGILRTLLTGTHIWSTSRVSDVMGMTLIRVDPATLAPCTANRDDRALTVLHGITAPAPEERPDPRLRGFLYLTKDRLRLYLDSPSAPSVIAADVRPSGGVTALLTALPSLLAEERLRTVDDADPHCRCLVDLTGP